MHRIAICALSLCLAVVVGLAAQQSGVTPSASATADQSDSPTVGVLAQEGTAETTGLLAFLANSLRDGEKLRPAGSAAGITWYLARGRLGEVCMIYLVDENQRGAGCSPAGDLEAGATWLRIRKDADGSFITAVIVPDGYSIKKTGSQAVESLRVLSRNLAVAKFERGATFELTRSGVPTITVQVPEAVLSPL